MPSIFDFFKLTPLAFKEALPRTIAPIIAAKAAQKSLEFFKTETAWRGVDPTIKLDKAGLQFAAGALTFSAIGAIGGYALGYGATNLLMSAYPFLKNMESRLLLKPGISPNLYLLMASILLPVAIEALGHGVTELSHHTSTTLGK